jgi:hypothetical protein
MRVIIFSVLILACLFIISALSPMATASALKEPSKGVDYASY